MATWSPGATRTTVAATILLAALSGGASVARAGTTPNPPPANPPAASRPGADQGAPDQAAAAAAPAAPPAGVQAAATEPLPANLPPGCLHGVAICISQDDDKLRLMDHGAQKLVLAVRFGAMRTPTRLGTYKVEWKDEKHVSKMFQSEMPYSLFFDGGQAIHYSSDFAARGYRGASHGCVNTRDLETTKLLFETVKIGTRVIVYTNDPAKQARIEKAAELAKQQDELDKQAQQGAQSQPSQQDPRDYRDQSDDQDQWDGPDDPSFY